MFNWIKSVFNVLLRSFKAFLSIAIPAAEQIIMAQLKDGAIQVISNLESTDWTNEKRRQEAFESIKRVAQEKKIEVSNQLIYKLIELTLGYVRNKVNG